MWPLSAGLTPKQSPRPLIAGYAILFIKPLELWIGDWRRVKRFRADSDYFAQASITGSRYSTPRVQQIRGEDYHMLGQHGDLDVLLQEPFEPFEQSASFLFAHFGHQRFVQAPISNRERIGD